MEWTDLWTNETTHKDERMNCAFHNAGKVRVKRSDTEESRVTAKMAYTRAPHLIYSMWALFGESASKMGYKVPSYAARSCDKGKEVPIVDNPEGLKVHLDPNRKNQSLNNKEKNYEKKIVKTTRNKNQKAGKKLRKENHLLQEDRSSNINQ